MKIKDIKAGVAYAKRDKSRYSVEWGVPVTTDYLYQQEKYSSGGRIYPGKSVLMLVKSTGFGTGKQKQATIEDACAKALTLNVCARDDIDVMNNHLWSEGLAVELWLPRDVEDTYEEVKQLRDAERQYDSDLKKSIGQEAAEIRAGIERMKEDLSLQLSTYVDTEDQRVTIPFDSWKKLMSRVEALVQSDPLIEGNL